MTPSSNSNEIHSQTKIKLKPKDVTVFSGCTASPVQSNNSDSVFYSEEDKIQGGIDYARKKSKKHCTPKKQWTPKKQLDGLPTAIKLINPKKFRDIDKKVVETYCPYFGTYGPTSPGQTYCYYTGKYVSKNSGSTYDPNNPGTTYGPNNSSSPYPYSTQSQQTPYGKNYYGVTDSGVSDVGDVTDSIQICVIDTSHKTITINTKTSHTVESVMETLRYKLSIPVDQQRLVFAGKSLEKTSTLGECGIVQESTLFLHLFILGGSSNTYANNYNGNSDYTYGYGQKKDTSGYSYDNNGNKTESSYGFDGRISGGYTDSSNGYGNYGQTGGGYNYSSSSGYSQYGQTSGYGNYGQNSGYGNYGQTSGYGNYGQTSGYDSSASSSASSSSSSSSYDSSSASRSSYYDDLRSSGPYAAEPYDSRFNYNKLQEDYNPASSRKRNNRSSNSSKCGAESSYSKSGQGYGGRK